jgi:hypothetical protein
LRPRAAARALDLAILLGWRYDELAPQFRDRLTSRIVEIAGPASAAKRLSHQMINMVAYAIGHHGPSGGSHRVQQGWQILDQLRRCERGDHLPLTAPPTTLQ